MLACPSLDTLRRFGIDSSAAECDHDVASHINECEVCRRAIEQIVREEPGSVVPRATRRPDLPELLMVPGFSIEDELGRGGMGVVFRAFQPRLKRRVALKFLPGGPIQSTRDRDRWLREAQSVARINHPYVVRLYDVGEVGGWFYLCLEYVPGGSLKDHTKEAIPPRTSAELVAKIALAVEHIHQADLLHLDLKPSNILIDMAPGGPLEQAIPKVADFGLARLRDDLDATGFSLGEPVGTPSFMAPEQVQGDRKALGPRTDVFALGSILYQMLTGRPPFLAGSVAETLHQVRSQEPVAPRRLNPSVPRDLDTICATCLQKDPRRRYASAALFAEDLRRWIDGRPIRARPVSAWEHTWRWARRRPAISSLIVVLALTLSIGIVVLLTLLDHSERERLRAEVALERARVEEQFASQAMGELNALFRPALGDVASLSSADIFPAVERVRKAAEKVKRHHGLGSSNLAPFGVFERNLAKKLSSLGKNFEANALFLDSLAVLKESRKLNERDLHVKAELEETIFELAVLAIENRKLDVALDYLEQGTALLRHLSIGPSDNLVCVRIDRIAETREEIAARFVLSDEKKRVEILEKDVRLFDALGADVMRNPEVLFRKELALAKLESAVDANRRLKAAIGRFPAVPEVRERLLFRLAEWLVFDLQPFSLTAVPSSRPGYNANPDAWAESVHDELMSRCVAMGLGLDSHLLNLVGIPLIRCASHTASNHRRVQELKEARSVCERLMSLSDAMIRHYPDESIPYMMKSDGYIHRSKNSWRDKDFVAIESSLRLALETANHGARLDPHNDQIQWLIKQIDARLINLDAERPRVAR